MQPTTPLSVRAIAAAKMLELAPAFGSIAVRDADTGEEQEAIVITDYEGKVTIVGIIPPLGKRFFTRPEVALDQDQAASLAVELSDVAPADIPMDNYRAAMIAEGVEEVSDEETYFAAWQHLEDTRLGYQLQGWFGRRLADLIAEGKITPRQPQED